MMNNTATPERRDRFPFFVQWHLTERCNLACNHCYQQGTPPMEMGLSQVRQTLENVNETVSEWSRLYDIPFDVSLNVTGGEPLVRTDLFEILREIRTYGFRSSLLTNGTLISRDIAAELREHQIAGVQVSLEGPEEIHDSIRGSKSFARAVRGIEHLLEQNMPITLNVTLSDVNARYVHDIIDIAGKLGVARVGFSRLVPNGKGANMLKNMLSSEELKKIYDEIASMHLTNLDVMSGDPLASQMDEVSDDRVGGFPEGGCAAGISGLTLMTDGTITPCRRIGVPIGNILTDSLRELWITSNVLNELRNKKSYEGRCGTCRRWSMCRGCRAVAYAYSVAHERNNLYEEDPQCFCYSGEDDHEA